MKEKKFFFISAYGMINMSQDLMFSDFLRDKRVMEIETNKTGHNRILFTLKKLHFSYKLNSIINLPFKSIWGRPLDIPEICSDNDNYIIIPHGYLNFLTIDYINERRKNCNIKFILILLDYWDSEYCRRARKYYENGAFDYVFTFDPKDAEKYGFTKIHTPYSMIDIDMPKTTDKNIIFVGNAKKRLSKLHEIYLYFQKNGIVTDFYINEVKKSNQLKDVSIKYNTPIIYSEYLSKLMNANCVLEILTEGQSGATSRYYEAVCYNKKLLTNNQDVVNLSYYNKNYIHVFNKVEDIDIEWIKDDTPVDFKYRGEFSPIALIDKIIKMESGKEDIG